VAQAQASAQGRARESVALVRPARFTAVKLRRGEATGYTLPDLLLLVRGTSLSAVPDPGNSGTFIGKLKNVTIRQRSV
jgi:hypothetical protein